MTKEWERHRDTILGLYKGEGKRLAEVMDIMEQRHGFKASTRAYRSRLRRWDCVKFATPSGRWMASASEILASSKESTDKRYAIAHADLRQPGLQGLVSSSERKAAQQSHDAVLSPSEHTIPIDEGPLYNLYTWYEQRHADQHPTHEANDDTRPPSSDSPMLEAPVDYPLPWLARKAHFGLSEDPLICKEYSYHPLSSGHDGRSAINDSDTFVDSAVSVKNHQGAHQISAAPTYLDMAHRKNQGRDDDLNRLLIAFKIRDHCEKQIDRIYEERPDLLALKEDDSDSDDDNDELAHEKAPVAPASAATTVLEQLTSKEDIMTQVPTRGVSKSRHASFDAAAYLPWVQGRMSEAPLVFHSQSHRREESGIVAGVPDDPPLFAESDQSNVKLWTPPGSGCIKPQQSYTKAPVKKYTSHLAPPPAKTDSAPLKTHIPSLPDPRELRYDRRKSHGSMNSGLDTQGTRNDTATISTLPASIDSADSTSSESTSEDSEELTSCDELMWLALDTGQALTPVETEPFFVTASSAIHWVIQSYEAWNRRGTGDTSSLGSSEPIIASGYQHDKAACGVKRSYETSKQFHHCNNDQGPLVKKGRKQITEGQRRLACHFQKHDPERYALCGIKTGGFDTIAHVKQHLKRSHQRDPNYCPRCMQTFGTEEQKNEHLLRLVSSPCPADPDAALPAGMSPETVRALTRRAGKGDDLQEQWFGVWDVIFPDIPRPQTCSLDLSGELHVQALGLCSYFETEGPRTVLSFLQEEGIVVGNGDGSASSDSVEAFTHRVLTQAFHQVFENWRSQRPRSADNAPPLDERSISGSSAQDSGVVLPTPINTSRHATDGISHCLLTSAGDSDLDYGLDVYSDGHIYDSVNPGSEAPSSRLDDSQLMSWVPAPSIEHLGLELPTPMGKDHDGGGDPPQWNQNV